MPRIKILICEKGKINHDTARTTKLKQNLARIHETSLEFSNYDKNHKEVSEKSAPVSSLTRIEPTFVGVMIIYVDATSVCNP